MVDKPRILQLLRRAGITNTNSEALHLLKSSKVTINGKIVTNPNYQANPKKDLILVNNKPLAEPKIKHYFILNKPKGYITAKSRINGQKHIMELFQLDNELLNSLFPIGRLDYDTTGLIIITNDGDFSHKILNPDSGIEKEYLAKVSGNLSNDEIKTIEAGLKIPVAGKAYTTKPAKVKTLETDNSSTKLSITISEGKKRQIRLMFSSVGHKVIDLKRIRIGQLHLGNLKAGSYKEIKKSEAESALVKK